MEEQKHFSFYQNRQCEYFPCHANIPEEEFNCLFCYCPLYALGKKCGGRCEYTDRGYKDCTHCTFPHWREHYLAVISRYDEIMEIVKQRDAQA